MIRPTARVAELTLQRKYLQLFIGSPDRVRFEFPNGTMIESHAGNHPLVEVLGFKQVAQELPRSLGVAGEFPDAEAGDRGRIVSTRRPGRGGVVVDILGDVHILDKRRVVRADGVVNPRTPTRKQVAIVAGIVPGQYLVRHRLVVQLTVVLHRRFRLNGTDGDLALFVDHLAAEAPVDGPEGRVRVAAMADGDADGMPRLLQLGA